MQQFMTNLTQPPQAQQQSRQQSGQQGGSYLRLSDLNPSALLNLSASADEGRPPKEVVAMLTRQRLVITDRERGQITGQQDQELEEQQDEQPSNHTKPLDRPEWQQQAELTNRTTGTPTQNHTIRRTHRTS